jgi:ABC-type Fe3+-hydroxamate transport system substrate-binding protein
MAVPPHRIVSLVPSLTETLCDLGVAARLVGVTRFCMSPEEPLRFVPRIGGTKNPDLEKIAGLDPDLVLLNGEENRREDVEWLGARFRVFETTPRSVPEAAMVVKRLGRELELDDAAEAVTLEIEAHMARADVMGVGLRRLRVFYPIWKQPWISVNRATYVHDLLERAGARNVCADREARYPVITQGDLEALRADLVLLPSEPFAFADAHRRRFLQERTFGLDVPVLMVDGRNFCWHGSRTGRGLGSAVNLLRPFRQRAA